MKTSYRAMDKKKKGFLDYYIDIRFYGIVIVIIVTILLAIF